MDQQTPPRTPVLDCNNHDEDIQKKGGALGLDELELVPINNGPDILHILSKPVALVPASTRQLLVSPRAAFESKTLDRILRLLKSANGLDKVIRTIQYTSRLLSHIMLLKNIHTDMTSIAAKGIRRQFGLTRRLLRCFNNIAQIDATLRILRESKQRINNDVVGYILDIIESVGYTGFGITDSLGYLPDAGIMAIPYQSVVDKMAFHFWLYALVASIVGGLIKIYGCRRRLLKYRSIFPSETATKAIEGKNDEIDREKKEGKETQRMVQLVQEIPPTPPESPIQPIAALSFNESASSVLQNLEEQQLNTSLNVIGYTSDIIFPLAALRFPPFSVLSDGVLGFAGCISSAVGLRKAWKATA